MRDTSFGMLSRLRPRISQFGRLRCFPRKHLVPWFILVESLPHVKGLGKLCGRLNTVVQGSSLTWNGTPREFDFEAIPMHGCHVTSMRSYPSTRNTKVRARKVCWNQFVHSLQYPESQQGHVMQQKKPKGQFNYGTSSSTSIIVLGGIFEALLL